MIERIRRGRLAKSVLATAVGSLLFVSCTNEGEVTMRECAAVNEEGDALVVDRYPLGPVATKFIKTPSRFGTHQEVTETTATIKPDADGFSAVFAKELPSSLTNYSFESGLRSGDAAIRFESPELGIFGVTRGCILGRAESEFGAEVTEIKLPTK